jgi:drug/metabolite transporter (DMT)-like permease
MKTAPIVGIILIVIGVISLAYQGITYTTHKQVLDLGPIHATEEQHHTIPLPPILGALALIGGVVVLVVGNKKTT